MLQHFDFLFFFLQLRGDSLRLLRQFRRAAGLKAFAGLGQQRLVLMDDIQHVGTGGRLNTAYTSGDRRFGNNFKQPDAGGVGNMGAAAQFH